jgi:hypothetical protein
MKILSALSFLVLLTLPATAHAQAQGGISTGNTNAKAAARIESKPEPKWPKLETRESVTIVLRAIFSKTGEVTNITFIKSDPEKPVDVSEKEIKTMKKRAIEAAGQIKFVPAMRDGHPVSMWMQLEYNFSPDAVKEKEKPD